MQVVYRARDLFDAHLAKHLLEEADLPVFVLGESLLGGAGELPLFGVIAVCVPSVVWPEARGIVEALPLNIPTATGTDLELDDPGLLPA